MVAKRKMGESMKIESKDTDIESLLDGSYFHIPRFQRPYSWDDDNINDFWNDLIANKGEDYFIGSMVVYKRAKQSFGVVDGQQRLTTTTILLCVLRDAFHDIGHADSAEGLHQLIERKDRDNKNEFVLKTETSFPYFQEHIQKFGEPEVDTKLLAEEQNLQRAHKLFRKLVSDSVDSVDKDTTIPDNIKAKAKFEKLTSIRDTVLNLNLIFVVLDSEDDAYLIFETLNTRGKDLSVSDLVKNHFTKHLKAKGSVDIAKIKWEAVMETIHNSSADLSTDMFIYHYWASRYEAVPLKKLFPVIKKRITKDTSKEHLESLVSDSKLYRAIHEPAYEWTKNETDAARSLSALQLFKVSQPTPAVLSLTRAYKNEKIKFGKFRDALAAIEKFHFLFTAVTSSRSSGGISAMYSAFARKLFEANSSQEAGDEIQELINKLRAKRPSVDEFVVAFREVSYTNTNSKQKNLIRYILRAVSEFHKYKYPCASDELTIEHLHPQSIHEGGWDEWNVGQIGNLIFLDQKFNEKLKTHKIDDKLSKLKDNGYDIPEELVGVIKWTPKQALERTDAIAKIAYNEVWRF
ncbi:RloF protein [Pseudomonas savastanoi pv. glycinea]|nr:RloF protein [Pseudomonas savastanoi pv. glycinea]